MAYGTDSTIVDFNSKSITGWRTGKRGNRLPPEADTCDQSFTLENPFDFSIDWRQRSIGVRERVFNKSKNRFYLRWRKKYISYPYFTFKKQSRTVREWRLIYLAGIKTIAESGVDSKHVSEINRRIDWLKKFLKKRGKCKVLAFKMPNEQHSCLAWHTELTGDTDVMVPFNSANYGALTNTATVWSSYWQKWVESEQSLSYSFGDGLYYNMSRRLFLPFTAATTGPSGASITTAAFSPVKQQWTSSLYSIPRSIAFDTINTIPTLTAMLWPDSADFEDSGAQPLVDIAEAISDGAFPLGPPPDPLDAHDRIMDNLMSDKEFSSLMAGKHAIDFAANAWLWDTLVLQPVISSAIALSTSVKANDLAIDKYSDAAKSGNWIKGKSLRFLKNPQNCINGGSLDPYEETYQAFTNDGEVLGTVFSRADIEVKQAEGNAMMVYKLSELDAAVLNSSGMRLAQFFNRLSTDLDQVLYNILPLSFVIDWFTSEFSGILNLKNKVYMPVADHKLIVSYKLKANVSMAKDCHYKCGVFDKYATSSKTYYAYGYLYNKLGTFVSGGYTYPMVGTLEKKHKSAATEELVSYDRRIYDRPSRRTDFSGPLGVDCLDTTKPDPLDTGKTVTLGALIWGFIT